jgi:hypothetical protein
MTIKFSEHGSFELQLDGNILVAKLVGGWNIEAAQKFSDNFKAAARPLTHADWGHLVFLDDWDTGIPGVAEIILALVNWCVVNRLKCAAHVYTPSAFKQYYVDSVVEERPGEFSRKLFDNKQRALEWLAEKGFHLNSVKSSHINFA